MNKSAIEQREERLSLVSFDLSQTGEVGGEVTLPDYYPEIKRIVYVTADALPDSKYLSNGVLEAGGTLAFNLLYMGEDGTLRGVPYATEYSAKFPIDKDFEGTGADIRLESTAESAFCRPLGPRTLSFKAKVKNRVYAEKRENCSLTLVSESGEVFSQRAVEHLQSEVETVSLNCFSATGSVTKEEEGVSAEPVSCCGELTAENVAVGEDSVTVKGSVVISCLCLTTEGIYKTFHFSVPYEERVTAEGARKGDRAAVHGRIASVTVNTNGENGLSIEAEYDLDAVIAKEKSVLVTDDVYSTEYELIPERKGINVQSLVCLDNKSISISGEGRRRSERREGDCIISCSVEAKFERADVRDAVINFSGNCDFKVYIASAGEVVAEEFSVPVKVECPCNKTDPSGGVQWRAVAVPVKAECRLEEGKIYGRCDLYGFFEGVKETKYEPVTRAVVGAVTGDTDKDCVIRICYPEKGTKIWDIAKKCRAPMTECERTNRVSRNDISDGTPILITNN